MRIFRVVRSDKKEKIRLIKRRTGREVSGSPVEKVKEIVDPGKCIPLYKQSSIKMDLWIKVCIGIPP